MDNAFHLYKSLKEQGFQYLEQWKKDKRCEDLFLEFKRKANPQTHKLDDSDRENLSKALSGFANANGGLLVWGLGENTISTPNGKVKQLSELAPILNHLEFEKSLLAALGQLTVPYTEVITLEIPFPNDSERGFVAMLIQKSERKPVFANFQKLRRYYKRVGDRFFSLEHHDVEELFKIASIPKIVPNLKFQRTRPDNDFTEWTTYIFLRNEGTVAAKYPFLRLCEANGIKPHKSISSRDIIRLNITDHQDWSANSYIYTFKDSGQVIQSALEYPFVSFPMQIKTRSKSVLKFEFICGADSVRTKRYEFHLTEALNEELKNSGHEQFVTPKSADFFNEISLDLL